MNKLLVAVTTRHRRPKMGGVYGPDFQATSIFKNTLKENVLQVFLSGEFEVLANTVAMKLSVVVKML